MGEREEAGTGGTFSGIFARMARLPRIVDVNTPHHVTQRCNARQFFLSADAERMENVPSVPLFLLFLANNDVGMKLVLSGAAGGQ
jgi:hypothetical protein